MVREIDLLEWLGQTSQVPNSWSYVMISGPAMLKSTLRNLSLTWPVARESDKLSNENNEMWLGMIRKVERYDKKPFGKLSFEYLDPNTNVTSNFTKIFLKKIRQCLTFKKVENIFTNTILLIYILLWMQGAWFINEVPMNIEKENWFWIITKWHLWKIRHLCSCAVN